MRVICGTFRPSLLTVKHDGCSKAVAGLLADARQLVDIARQESAQYRSYYGSPIPCKVVSFCLFLFSCLCIASAVHIELTCQCKCSIFGQLHFPCERGHR